MKAKFIYEAIEDVLKGKSEEEILSSMSNLSPNKLLIKSSEKGFLPGVKKALEMGANIHALDDHALRQASYYNHYDVVEFLLKHGADVHAKNDYALHWSLANDYYDIVELLLKHGADVHTLGDYTLGWILKNDHKDVVKLLKKYMYK